MTLQCVVYYSEIQHGSKIIPLDDQKFNVLLSNKEARECLGDDNSHEQQCNFILISFDVQNMVLMLVTMGTSIAKRELQQPTDKGTSNLDLVKAQKIYFRNTA